MKRRYAVPLALGIVLAEPFAYGATSVHNPSKGGIEEVVKSSNTNRLEELLGGMAYGQNSAEAKTYNPREEFRKLGWEVYDAPELIGRPERVYEYKILPERFVNSLNSSNKFIKDIFSDEESLIIKYLIDRRLSGDELSFIFVTQDNYIALTISTSNKNVGKNGLYSTQKKLTQENADKIRKISPDYKVSVFQ